MVVARDRLNIYDFVPFHIKKERLQQILTITLTRSLTHILNKILKKHTKEKQAKKGRLETCEGKERDWGGGGWKIVHTSGKILATPLITSKFWKHVFSWLRDNNIHDGIINEPDVIFGKCDIVKDYILINHILLFGKVLYLL